MKVSFEHGYRKNEWLAVYVDECGDRQIVAFDTYEQASSYLECCDCKIGVMTTAFYENCTISKDYFEAIEDELLDVYSCYDPEVIEIARKLVKEA